MSYKLSSAPAGYLVDPEFDRLDKMIAAGQQDQVSKICLDIIRQPNTPVEKASWANFLRGLIAIRDGNFEETINFVSLATSLPKPLQSRAKAFLAISLSVLNRFEEAANLLASASQEYPPCAYIEYARAIYFKNTGKDSECWEHSKRALLINPAYNPAIDELVSVGFKLGLFGEVARILKTFLESSPLDLTAHSFMALALNLDGQVVSAMREMEHILAFAGVVEMNPEMLNIIRQTYTTLKSQVVV